MFNSHYETVVYKIPDERWGRSWLKIIDTYEGLFDVEGKSQVKADEKINVMGRSVMILMRKTEKNT